MVVAVNGVFTGGVFSQPNTPPPPPPPTSFLFFPSILELVCFDQPIEQIPLWYPFAPLPDFFSDRFFTPLWIF